MISKIYGKPLNVEDFKINETEIEPSEKIHKPICRWCHGPTRANWNNGIIGPGYAEGCFVCRICGRMQ